MNSTLTVSELRKLLHDLLDISHAGDLQESSLFSTGPPRCAA